MAVYFPTTEAIYKVAFDVGSEGLLHGDGLPGKPADACVKANDLVAQARTTLLEHLGGGPAVCGLLGPEKPSYRFVRVHPQGAHGPEKFQGDSYEPALWMAAYEHFVGRILLNAGGKEDWESEFIVTGLFRGVLDPAEGLDEKAKVFAAWPRKSEEPRLRTLGFNANPFPAKANKKYLVRELLAPLRSWSSNHELRDVQAFEVLVNSNDLGYKTVANALGHLSDALNRVRTGAALPEWVVGYEPMVDVQLYVRAAVALVGNELSQQRPGDASGPTEIGNELIRKQPLLASDPPRAPTTSLPTSSTSRGTPPNADTTDSWFRRLCKVVRKPIAKPIALAVAAGVAVVLAIAARSGSPESTGVRSVRSRQGAEEPPIDPSETNIQLPAAERASFTAEAAQTGERSAVDPTLEHRSAPEERRRSGSHTSLHQEEGSRPASPGRVKELGKSTSRPRKWEVGPPHKANNSQHRGQEGPLSRPESRSEANTIAATAMPPNIGSVRPTRTRSDGATHDGSGASEVCSPATESAMCKK